MGKEKASRLNQGVGLGAVVLGGILILSSVRLGIGTVTLPGPGAWPFLLSICLILLGGSLLMRPAPSDQNIVLMRPRWGKLVLALVTLLGYALLLDTLGYLVATGLLLLVQLHWVEDRSWKVSILTALIAAVVSFTVFVFWLNVSLPPGIVPIRAS